MPFEYGKKPYVKTGRGDDGYHTTRRLKTNKQMEDNLRRKWSEFEFPYRTRDYHGMQHYDRQNFRMPYLRFPNFPPELPPEPTANCAGAVLRATSSKGQFPEVDCDETIELYMDGNDGDGKPWDQADIIWQPLGGFGFLNGTLVGNKYTPVSCESLEADEDCVTADKSDTIIGYHKGVVLAERTVRSDGCGRANIIISITTPEGVCEEGGESCAIGTGNSISGPDAPVDSDEYSVAGVDDADIIWTITAGSITPGGVVTVSGECGVATVTATMCSETITKNVTMPSGVWVFDVGCDPGTTGSGACPEHSVVTEFKGIYKYEINAGGGRQRHCSDGSQENCCSTLGADCTAAAAVSCPGAGSCTGPEILWPHVDRYIWSCP